MFTGLIEEIGQLKSVVPAGPGRRLHIACSRVLEGIALGDSVAVDGACLTVSAFDTAGFEAEASRETVARTTLGQVRAGKRVHIERALRVGDRLGGHMVTGHVDGGGALATRRAVGDAWELHFEVPRDLAPQIVAKGSIAVDGVSLTVNDCGVGYFTVVVVPFTGKATTLLERQPGAKVNIETDLIGKYVVHVLGARTGGESKGLAALLREQGFV